MGPFGRWFVPHAVQLLTGELLIVVWPQTVVWLQVSLCFGYWQVGRRQQWEGCWNAGDAVELEPGLAEPLAGLLAAHLQ